MKRRKSSRSDASSPQEKVTKVAAKEKSSVDILNIDENDAEKSDAASDVKSYRMACEEIKKLIEEINDLKSEGNKSNVSFIQKIENSNIIFADFIRPCIFMILNSGIIILYLVSRDK